MTSSQKGNTFPDISFSIPAHKDQEQAPKKHVRPPARNEAGFAVSRILSLFSWGCTGLVDTLLFLTLSSASGTYIGVHVQGMDPYGTRWAWKGLIGRSEGFMETHILIQGWTGALSRTSSVLRVWFIPQVISFVIIMAITSFLHWQVSKPCHVFLGNIKIQCLHWLSPWKDAVSPLKSHLRCAVYFIFFSCF